MPPELPAPWLGFVRELDALLEHEVQLHCCGGFVVTTQHGLARSTADLDVLSVAPREDLRRLAAAARQGSALHKKYGVYLDVVTVATYPDEYESRLIEMQPETAPPPSAVRVGALRPGPHEADAQRGPRSCGRRVSGNSCAPGHDDPPRAIRARDATVSESARARRPHVGFVGGDDHRSPAALAREPSVNGAHGHDSSGRHRAIDRSALGTMVNFAKGLPYYREARHWEESDLLRVEDRMAETPCRSVAGDGARGLPGPQGSRAGTLAGRCAAPTDERTVLASQCELRPPCPATIQCFPSRRRALTPIAECASQRKRYTTHGTHPPTVSARLSRCLRPLRTTSGGFR